MLECPFLQYQIPLISVTLGQLIGGAIVLVVGLIVAGIIKRIFVSRMRRRGNLPELAVEFLKKFLGALLLVVVIILTLGALGINVGSVVVGLSAVVGLVLGFGMQDTIENISAGIWLVVLSAFDKGEFIEIKGTRGKVENVGLLATVLLTPDNKYITVPNSQLWDEAIVNYSRMPIRRADVGVGVAYDTDMGVAIETAMATMKAHELVLDDPAPAVFTTELADSSVNLQLRPWTKSEDYWQVVGDIRNRILASFAEKGIEIPFPQLDVSVKK